MGSQSNMTGVLIRTEEKHPPGRGQASANTGSEGSGAGTDSQAPADAGRGRESPPALRRERGPAHTVGADFRPPGLTGPAPAAGSPPGGRACCSRPGRSCSPQPTAHSPQRHQDAGLRSQVRADRPLCHRRALTEQRRLSGRLRAHNGLTAVLLESRTRVWAKGSGPHGISLHVCGLPRCLPRAGAVQPKVLSSPS